VSVVPSSRPCITNSIDATECSRLFTNVRSERPLYLTALHTVCMSLTASVVSAVRHISSARSCCLSWVGYMQPLILASTAHTSFQSLPLNCTHPPTHPPAHAHTHPPTPIQTPTQRAGSPRTQTAIILIPDIWGWNGGRTRLIADGFAKELGCVVCVA
jgi:hypothetical protein